MLMGGQEDGNGTCHLIKAWRNINFLSFFHFSTVNLLITLLREIDCVYTAVLIGYNSLRTSTGKRYRITIDSVMFHLHEEA